MKAIETEISWGYLPLIEIFAKANNLEFIFEIRNITEPAREFITIHYEENSDTDMTVTCLSIKHLGFKNMLDDYLIKCHVDPNLIPIGKAIMKKDPILAEKEWQEHRRKIGLIR